MRLKSKLNSCVIKMSTVLKQLGVVICMLFSVVATAQVKTAPIVPKSEETKRDSNSSNAAISTLKKDTNTYTIINITGTSNKNSKLNSDTDQPNDVKTVVTKAKQNSKHWFDSFIVNIICVGVNTFVKED